MADTFLEFSKFLGDEDPAFLKACEEGAREKLETLYPTKRIRAIDTGSIVIESDSLYAQNGFETYFLGLVDEEFPAMQRAIDGEIITFRV